jgi:RHS repeat-associated protein
VYDEVGRLLEQTDTRGDTLTSTYTAAGLRESLTYPDGTETVYTFDAAGDVATQSTPEGVVEYAWDAESRLVGIERPNQVSSSFEYDALGQVTRVRHETPESESVPVAEPAPEPLKRDAVECRAVGSYLAERQASMAGGQKPCVKTWDYLERRTLPEVESPVPAGASLEYTYEYDAAGSVTDSVRTITGPAVPELDEGSPVDGPDAPSTPEPGTVSEPGTVPELDEGPAATTQTVDTLTHAFAYDNLGRLTRSEASDGEMNTYGYDAAGNRTAWNINGAEAGSSQLTAEFNAAGQLTSTTTTGANAGSATYTFDGAGNRSGQTVNGTQTSFHHDPAGRLQSTQTEGRSTSYTYDGLDRRTSVTDDTRFGSDTTSTTWDGLTPVATDSDQHGVTDLLRDPTGEVVFQSGAYDDVWALGDMRNVTATANGAGRITDLVDYTDFGAAGFESTGWASLVGNDGQPGDATLGLDHYYARDYDTATGSWVQPDEWRGLLVRPQSLNRFAYVENDPVGFSDFLGYLPIGGGLKAGIAKANLKNAITKGAIAAALGKQTETKVPKHSMGKRAVTAPRNFVKNPSNRSSVFTTQLHLLNMSGCGFSDTACRGTVALAGASSGACFFGSPDNLINCLAHPITSGISGIVSAAQKQIESINRWIYENLSAGVTGSICGIVCLEVGLGTGGPSVGFGVGIEAGMSFQVGANAFSQGGWSQSLSCTATFGPYGVYGEFGVGEGGVYPVGGGWAPGAARLGCGIMARYEWSIW